METNFSIKPFGQTRQWIEVVTIATKLNCKVDSRRIMIVGPKAASLVLFVPNQKGAKTIGMIVDQQSEEALSQSDVNSCWDGLHFFMEMEGMRIPDMLVSRVNNLGNYLHSYEIPHT